MYLKEIHVPLAKIYNLIIQVSYTFPLEGKNRSLSGIRLVKWQG